VEVTCGLDRELVRSCVVVFSQLLLQTSKGAEIRIIKNRIMAREEVTKF